MTLVIYGLKNCDTCRKALKTIEKAYPRIEFVDVRKDGVPEALLQQALQTLGRDKVINTRSTTWRELSETARAGAAMDLLKTHPTLMKRPLISAANWLSVGWSSEIQQDLEAWIKTN